MKTTFKSWPAYTWSALRCWFVCLALATCGAGSLLAAAEPATDFQQAVGMWKNKQYLEVIQILKEYRQGPYGKTPEVDYMIASSMCRLPGYESKGQQYFQWLLYNHRLDERSRGQVIEEMRNCASAQTPVVINFVVVRSGAGARVGGKMFYSWEGGDLPISTVPVQVLRDIPASEMVQRLVPLSDPVKAISAVKRLMGPDTVAETHGHFLLVKKSDSAMGDARSGSSAERLRSRTGLAEFGNLLEQYLNFFTREFKMQMPTNFITVYCLPNSKSVRETAQSLHGIRVSELSIGYSFRDDLSLVGLFDGTLFHELFHLLVYNNFGDIPPWLDEGIAALYEVSRIRGAVVEGLPNWRGDVLREFRGSRPSVEQLIRMDWRNFDDEAGESRGRKPAANHATARYLMLMLQERNQLAAMYHAFRSREVEALQSDPAAEAIRLVEKVTSKSVAALDKDFEEWLESALNERSRDTATRPLPSPDPTVQDRLRVPTVSTPANTPADATPNLKVKVSSSASEEEIRRSVKLRASRGDNVVDTLPNGRARRLYSIWIEAPTPIIHEIARVRYHYDPAKFSDPTREESTPYNGFMNSYIGIGAVDADMDIDLVLHDGRRVTLKFNMYQALFGK
jgi:hypothetical protein